MCFLLWQKRILRFAFPVGSEELRRGNGAMRFSVRSFGYALFYITERRNANEKDNLYALGTCFMSVLVFLWKEKGNY